MGEGTSVTYCKHDVPLEMICNRCENLGVTQTHNVQFGGDHYVNMAVQPWTAMESWMTPEQFNGFLRGNVIKYVARCSAKGSEREDLLKAIHYLEKLLDRVPE